VADVFLNSQKNFYNVYDEIEHKYVDDEDQESINSPRSIALSKITGTYIEPFAVFEQNHKCKFESLY
jgi:hypothetical protein